MSRIAILADIHGNLPALDAVLADVDRQAVDEILVGGDLVGRGPDGSAVSRRIRQLGLATIGGNHEDYLLTFRRGDVPEDWKFTDEWAAARWMAAELDDEDVGFLADLPFSLESHGLRLVHGTPRSNREGIGPWTGENELVENLGRVDEEVLVCAHTHRPLVRHLDQGLVVNVGSVGLPFNRDARAQYAIFDRSPGGSWDVELRQVEYDREAIYSIYETSGFLAEGGITARLLRLELEHSTPLLVPFLEWSRASGEAATLESLPRFLEVYSPGEPLGPFFQRLREIRAARDGQDEAG